MINRNRRKQYISLALILALLLPLGGCWNYRSLSDMAFVAGLAVDQHPENEHYLLSFEIINLTKPVKEQGLQTLVIDSEGETIFDAVRNAKKKVKNKLFFGHMMTVIISEEIARSEKIPQLIDWFLRDAECRETMYFLISQEKTAAEVFSAQNVDSAVLSYELESILEKDKEITLSTNAVQLHDIYNLINSKGQALSLPAVHIVRKEDNPRLEINGTAVFKDKSLVGYLSPEDSKYLLFALDDVGGGALTVPANDNAEKNIALEISKSKTKRTFENKEGQRSFKIETDTEVFVGESAGQLDAQNKDQINQIKDAAQKKLEQGISDVIKKVQDDFQSDIFGFGKLIHKTNPVLWAQLEENWDEEFKNISVEVTSKVLIKNTALLKEYGSG